MTHRDSSLEKIRSISRLLLASLLLCGAAASSLGAAGQTDSEVSPDATPQIQQITPGQAVPGAHLTVVIQGSNFSAGAYVSSISAAIHVDSSKRVSATQLEAQLIVSPSAQPSTVSLLVSNPASRAAEAAFKVVAGEAPAPPAKETVEPPKTATPSTPPAPEQEVKPPTPATPTAPPTPPTPAAPTPATPAAPGGPEVTAVAPSRVSPGFDVDLKITGKNLAQGTKVSFANPGIRVMSTSFTSSTDLTVHIKVASDAAAGTASMFVINPDDREVETSFEVTGKGAADPAKPSSPAAPSTLSPAATQSYEAFHLGSPAEFFETHGKLKGSLVVSAENITYAEGGKTLITMPLSDIKEIKTSSIATATFHITLTSGKTYHFAPGSGKPSDARQMVDSLRKVLPHP